MAANYVARVRIPGSLNIGRDAAGKASKNSFSNNIGCDAVGEPSPIS